jgi:hypothetical protein
MKKVSPCLSPEPFFIKCEIPIKTLQIIAQIVKGKGISSAAIDLHSI